MPNCRFPSIKPYWRFPFVNQNSCSLGVPNDNTPVSSPSSSFVYGTYFERFLASHPEWHADQSSVLFRDHHQLKDKPGVQVERFQKSGLCFMHGPVVAQHYLVAMNNPSSKIPMLNMVDYLKRKMTARYLFEHIFNNHGGNSFTFVMDILAGDIKREHFFSYEDEAITVQALKSGLDKYGLESISFGGFEQGFRSFLLKCGNGKRLGREINEVFTF